VGYLIALAVLWLAGVAIVNPVGDFPLNDDWIYSWPVKTYIDTGRIDILSCTGFTLIGHVLWGIVSCSIFGFSFTVLRMSSVVLALAGILVTYWIFRTAKASRGFSLLAALVVGFNPLYYEISFTFMTDVSFAAFGLMGLLFLNRYLESERSSCLIAATVVISISTLIREVGLLLPAAFAAIYLLRHGWNMRSALKAALPLIVAVLGFVLYRIILAAEGGSPSTFDFKLRIIMGLFDSGLDGILAVLDRLHQSVVYLGLFALPFTIWISFGLWRSYAGRERWWCFGTSAATAALLIARLLYLQRLMPLSRNVLFDFGLGPLTLKDTGVLKLPNYVTAPESLWLGITVLAVFSASVLTGFFVTEALRILPRGRWKTAAQGPQFLIAGGVLLSYVGLISLSGLFDRYLIYLVPFCLLAFYYCRSDRALRISGAAKGTAILVAVVLAVFAIGATHDYLAWNRARWEALDYLTVQRNITPERIDGGFEFNGWYLYDETYVPQRPRSWWWVHDDEFIISFGLIPGYEIERSYPFVRYMPPGQPEILLLRRAGTDHDPAENRGS